jgi:hypothetical protein
MRGLTNQVHSMVPEEGNTSALDRHRRRRKREVGRAGWAKRPSGPTGCWVDWAES